MMPQMSDQLEQPVQSACNTVAESSDKLLKPGDRSPRLRSVGTTPPSENGSVTSGKGRTYSNGLVVSAAGAVQSHGKNHSNKYVWEFFVLFCSYVLAVQLLNIIIWRHEENNKLKGLLG